MENNNRETNRPITSSNSGKKVRLQYEEHSAKYASQVVLNGTKEEVFLDFSSGPIPGNNAETIVPIHTRIAMSHSAARRLLSALQQTLVRSQAKPKEARTDPS
ncbi:MAG: DUF3467 domain-containing protein [Puniceicoccales bacterium]